MKKTKTDRRIKVSLFFFFLALYLLVMGDHFTEPFYSSDENLLALTTVSIAQAGTLHFPETYGMTTAKFGVLHSIAAIPFYLLAKLIVPLVPADLANITVIFCIYCTNAVITALVLVLFYAFSRWLRYPGSVALAATLALGLTTILFPYARMFFAEPLTALTLLIAVWQMARYGRSGQVKALIGSAIWFGLAILTRTDNLTLLLVFLLAIIQANKRHSPDVLSPQFRIPQSVPCIPRAAFRIFKHCLVFLLTLLPVGAILLGINYHRYGSWRFGYAEEAFSTPLLAGVYGLLFSTGRGLFVYSPLLIAVPFIWPRFFRRHHPLALLILAIAVIKIFFFAKWWSWQGGWSWGSRFLLPLVPLLFLPLNEIFLRWRRYSLSLRISLLVLLLAGLAVQLVAVLSNPNKFGNDIFTMIGQDENQFLFIPQLSFLAGNWQLIRYGLIDSFTVHFGERYGQTTLIIILIFLGLMLLLSAVGLIRRGGLRLREQLARLSVPLDTWNRKAVAALLVLNFLIFFVCWLASATNKISREVQVENAGERTTVATARDPLIMMDQNKPDPAIPAELTQPPLYRWRGWIMIPLSGDYTFHIKSSGFYALRIAGHVHAENREETQQHVLPYKANLKKGIYPITVEYQPVKPDYRLFRLYWTAPGFGIYRSLLSSQYFFAEHPSGIRQGLMVLDNFKFLVLILSLMGIYIFNRITGPATRA